MGGTLEKPSPKLIHPARTPYGVIDMRTQSMGGSPGELSDVGEAKEGLENKV